MEKKKKPELDPRISFTETNIARWTGAFGVRTSGKGGIVERILERRNEKGEVTSWVRVSAVGYNGKMHIISFEHKKMWNLIERLYERQGRPESGWVEISSIAFYDYLFDIASLADPSKRKFRHGTRYSDMVFDLLMVLMLTPWSCPDWEAPKGSRSAQVIHLVDKFAMYGREVPGCDATPEFGKIRVHIHSMVAAGLREHNTTPILLEVQNSIKSPTAGILYGFLAQVLFKMPIFDEDVFVLAEKLQLSSKGHVVRDLRRACKEIEGLDFASGRIIECFLKREGRSYRLHAVRGVKERRVVNADVAEERRRAEEQRMRDQRIEEDAYLRRYEDLPAEEKVECEKLVEEIVARNCPTGIGLNLHRKLAIIEVMETLFQKKNDQLVGRICAPELVAREKQRFCLHGCGLPDGHHPNCPEYPGRPENPA